MQNYLIWLFHQRSRQDKIGDLARDAFQDPDWDGKMLSLKKCILAASVQAPSAMDAYEDSLKEFRGQRKKY